MTINLDIAATLSAVLWPLGVLAILLAYRKKLPVLANALASRMTKLELAGVSLELAVAKSFAPDWSAGVAIVAIGDRAQMC